MQTDYAELEIGLRWRREVGGFDVALHYNGAGEYDNRKLGEEPLRIDRTRLAELITDEDEYGRELSDSLFSLADMRSFFETARGVTEREQDPLDLHLRLLIDPRAPAAYHALRWETLRDPRDGRHIALMHRILFSRYLSSSDWRPIAARPRHALSALIAVANPKGIDRYTSAGGVALGMVKVQDELEQARNAFGEPRVTPLASRGMVTLDRIVAELKRGRHDILYLVCHGALHGDQPRLYLEQSDGGVALTDGTDLVEGLRELDQRPTLVVLTACQSAGLSDDASSQDDGALAALGPRLAESGIPAVVAMQGNITMQTVTGFMPRFFTALRRSGLVDEAMADARTAIRERHDWWAPVLFSRLRTGRMWYVPEFAAGATTKWATLLQRIELGRCTPILGPAMSDGIVGSRQEIAAQWADRWQIPMAPHNREDLAKVAQYLTVSQDLAFPRWQLQRDLKTLFKAEYGDRLPADLLRRGSLDGLITEVGRLHREADPADPYRIMAELPFPMYITTSWTSLLEAALAGAHRKAVVDAFAWHKQIVNEDDDSSPAAHSEPVEITADNPLVYRLFGHIDNPDSLVLTEDDYLLWLESWMDNRRQMVLNEVTRALAGTTLLFLGFRLDDSNFRVLFHAIKALKGSERKRPESLAHVGVQLNPESNMIESEAAQDYLESYFGENKVSIYWGSTNKFLQELQQRWNEEQGR